MKLNKIIYTVTALSLMLITGCNKWLDVQPETTISERDQFATESGFKDAMLGVYVKLSDARTYGRNLTFGFMDVVGQCYNINTADANYAQAVKLNFLDPSARKYVDSIWQDMYANIGNVNQILSHLDSTNIKFSGRYKNQLKGEALAMRAFLHFDLLRMFGTSPALNPEAKSIPYVTLFKVKVFPALTVKEVMEKCLADLAIAEGLLAEDKSIVKTYDLADPYRSFTRHHMNFWAVKGLQARIHLYKGDKPAALTAAREVISNQATHFPFVTLPQASTTYNRDYTYANEHLFAVFINNLKSLSDAHFLGNIQGGPAILPLTETHLKTMYETAAGNSTDIRYNYLFGATGSAWATMKYSQFNIVSNNPESDYLRTHIPLIRISEIYYIAAEAAPTPEEGTAYLNVIRQARGISQLPLNQTVTTLDNELRKEIKKECYAEGQNFYYFKRKNAGKITTIANGSLTVVPANYLLPIPEVEKEYGDY
ncbi:RagB/SusD family nutrient uptake outer membrane protein [Pseudobacter ginsenosidimutans]|uniref:SusD-like starch-binding protein associating with outer membrane n=1 Tax=Pseudobacter ginsenosidimutans TaxID=661488 RepID=A0A4Q7N2W2_9BACT|nr:RagB/SusD family nutrient uptake outer membrane protein [Pseudobacter ginsenosidimutans]QEC43947.1 RagB/SusD family nutrient uptake outer membrane protein [Pseudobacter ginsenosidimutans]RZS75379.1 SusD-like starch-binding protein associating with outer membrane [Pseudobacter ginsenosidimutans]